MLGLINDIMNNKKLIESFNNPNQDNLKNYIDKIGKGPDDSTTKRIFPPKSILFETKEDAKSIEKKYSYNTLNSFKPKLQSRAYRQFSTISRKNKVLQNEKVDEKKIAKKSEVVSKKFDKTLESELNHLSQQRKLKLAARKLNDKQFSRDPFDLKMSANFSEQMSPYAKYSANWFPKKNLKEIGLKNKIFNQNREEYLIDLGERLKLPMSEDLQAIDSRLSQFSSPNILEVMTIFSIKDQKKIHNVKHDFIRKKELFKSLVPQKQVINRSKKKEYRQNEVQIDTNTDKVYFKKIYSFLSFLSKVNFSNNLPINNICINQRYNGEKIKVFVGKGNNKYLIIALLRRRFWFQVTNKITKDTKFIWTQNSIKNAHSYQHGKKIQKRILKMNTQMKQEQSEYCTIQKSLNRMNPEQSELKLYKSYVDGILVNKFDLRQDTNSLESSQDMKSKLKLLKSMKDHRNKKLFINNKKAQKADNILQNFKIITKTKLIQHNFESIHTITNHIPHNSFIGSKKALFYTMEHYYRNIKNIDPFTIIPKTYHFKTLDDEAYSIFLEKQKKVNEKSIWIVKPGQCTNRGNGIYLMKAGDISRKLLKKQLHDNGQLKTTIVQSYIMDPLLYNGRKFDIRHYMMVTIVNGHLKAYWYRQGYLRTSSQFFSLQNLVDPFIHLTNDAIQKTSQKYGRYEPGNKLSYSEFQRYLDSAFTKSNVNFREQILSEMKQIATDVIKANYLNLDRQRKMNNFEIFGMDFMIDSKFKPWLIQINSNPCLEISCHLLSRIIPIMVEHSLRLGLDPLILPPSHYPPNNRYYLSDNFIENLRYEIIFDEEQESCLPLKGMTLKYDFQFDEPEDEYQNQGTQIDLAQILD